jgi:hypothetical protein
MKLSIGIALFILGTLSCGIGYVLNGSTPIQVGPIPTIGGAALAIIGLMLFLSAI